MVMQNVSQEEQSWLDRQTLTDDLLRQLISVVGALERDIKITMPSGLGMPNQERVKALLQGADRASWQGTFDMSVAATDKEILVDGDFIHAWTDGVLEGIYIRPNNKSIDHNLFYFKRRNPIKMQFQKFFITWPVQSGKTLDIMVGREASSEGTTSEVTVTTVQNFQIIESAKASHFSGAIAQYAMEEENLTGLVADNLRITGITLLADQQLKFKVLLFYKDTFANADLDVDEFCGEVEVDLPSYGFQVAATGKWCLDVRNLHLDYTDVDASKELHIALMNMSPTTKLGTTDGEVVVRITYEPRA